MLLVPTYYLTYALSWCLDRILVRLKRLWGITLQKYKNTIDNDSIVLIVFDSFPIVFVFTILGLDPGGAFTRVAT